MEHINSSEVKILIREEAVEALNDNDEHRFIMESEKGPVFVVEEPLAESKKIPSDETNHEVLKKALIRQGIIKQQDDVVGGYCRVEEQELLLWGPAVSIPAPEESVFQRAVDLRGIKLMNQQGGFGPRPTKKG